MQFRIEMCVYTFFKVNLIDERVKTCALKEKINFTLDLPLWGTIE